MAPAIVGRQGTKRASTRLLKTTALVTFFAFTLTQVLPPGFANSTPLYPGGPQAPTSDPLAPPNEEDSPPSNPNDFLDGGSPLSPATETETVVTPYYDRDGNLVREITKISDLAGNLLQKIDYQITKNRRYTWVYEAIDGLINRFNEYFRPGTEEREKIDYYTYEGGIRTEREHLDYDPLGIATRHYFHNYDDLGKKVLHVDDMKLKGGLNYIRYVTDYEMVDGAREKVFGLTERYRSDGLTVKSAHKSNYEDQIRVLINDHYFDAGGDEIRLITKHLTKDAANLVYLREDTRSKNGIRTRFTVQAYVPSGVRRSLEVTSFDKATGLKATEINQYLFAADGKMKTHRHKQVFDENENRTRNLFIAYHEGGKKPKEQSDCKEENGKTTICYLSQYLEDGTKTHYKTNRYYADGLTIKSSNDNHYNTGGKLTDLFLQAWDSEGNRIRFYHQGYNDAEKRATRDDYQYDAAGNLTKNSYLTFNPDETVATADHTNYPEVLGTSQPAQTITFFVDGIEYQKTLDLLEGPNVATATVTGYEGATVLVRFQITLDTVAPEIVFTSAELVNNKDYTLTYTVDGTGKEKDFVLSEGANNLTVTETDTVGNTTELRWTVTYTPPPFTFPNSAKWTQLAEGNAQIELALENQNSNPELTQFSVSIDGGAHGAKVDLDGPVQINLPEGGGRRWIEIKFYNAAGELVETEVQEFNLDAARAAEGLVRTDRFGNLRNLYDRELLVTQTDFPEANFEITAPTHGATLPSLSTQFGVVSADAELSIETGFTLPETFIDGTAVEGTVTVAIENGFFVVTVKRPREEVVDGVRFLAEREDQILSRHVPAAGELFELQFDFTLDGLEIYLDAGVRGAASEPLLVLQGAQADPYLSVTSADIAFQNAAIFGNTGKILGADGTLHTLTYDVQNGTLREVVDDVDGSRFEDQTLNQTAYTLTQTFDAAGRLTSTSNRIGETTDYVYDGAGRLTSRAEQPTGLTETNDYETEADGTRHITNTISLRDGFDNDFDLVTETWVNVAGERVRVETAEGVVVVSQVQGNTATAAVTDGAFEYTVSRTEDAQGRMTQTVNRFGVTEERAYTRLQNGSEEIAITRTTPNGNETYETTERLLSDREGRLLEREDVSGRVEKFVYDAEGDVTRFEDGRGRVVTTDYTKNPLGAPERVTETLTNTDDFDNQINAVSARALDPFGNVIAEVDPDGNARVHVYTFFALNHKPKTATTYFYKNIDTLDALLAKHAAAPSEVTALEAWDEIGAVVKEVAPDESITSHRIDYTTEGLIGSQTTQHSFPSRHPRESGDPDNNVPNEVDSRVRGNDDNGGADEENLFFTWSETSEFDTHGNLVREVDRLGNETTYDYGAYDELLSTTTSLSADTTGEFDRVRTLDEVRRANGTLSLRTERTTFKDGFDNAINRTDTEEYDTRGRLTHVVRSDGSGDVIEYEFRTNGQLETQTVYRYPKVTDLTDLKNQHATPTALREKTTFGVLGDVIRIETFDDRVITFARTRDTEGRTSEEVETRNWITGDGRNVTTELRREYDVDGNLTLAVDEAGDETIYRYGPQGSLRETIEKMTFTDANGDTNIFEKRVEYDEERATSGKISTYSSTYYGEDSFGNTYQYQTVQDFDALGDGIASIDDKGRGLVTEYERFPWDAISEVSVYEYDGVSTLAELTAAHAAAPNLIEHTEFDARGEVTRTRDKDGLRTHFTRVRRDDGTLERETRTFEIEGEADKIFTDEFDPEGRRVRAVDDEGVQIVWTYATPGDLTTQTETGAGNHEVVTTYSVERDANGLDHISGTTIAGIDQYDRLVDLSNTETFNARGELIHAIDQDGNGQEIIRTRDSRDRLREQTTTRFFTDRHPRESGDPDNNVPNEVDSRVRGNDIVGIKKWDARGNLILEETDGKRSTVITIDTNALGRPQRLIKETTTFEEDESSELRRTKEVFDDAGYLTRYEDGFGSTMDYTRGFDGAALQLKETRDDGAWVKTTTFDAKRDESGRLVKTEESSMITEDGETTDTSSSEQLFDTSQRLTRRTDETGVITFFNEDGDIVRVEDPDHSTDKTYDIEKYATGTLKSKKETVSVTADNVDGEKVTTTVFTESHYDIDGRLARFVDTEGEDTLYTYTDAGETESITFPDGRKIEYTYKSDLPQGSRTITEVQFVKDSDDEYVRESELVKTYDRDGELVFLSELVVSKGTRQEFNYFYRELTDPDSGESLKRIDSIRELQAGEVTMHYYFYTEDDTHEEFEHTVPKYWDLDQDEAGEDRVDLDFVIQVRGKNTPETSDDEIQVVHYAGEIEAERVEKRITFQAGGLAHPARESGYVYHFDGSLDQVVDYSYDYRYNPETESFDPPTKQLNKTTTYKPDPTGSEPRTDKVTSAHSIKNYFYSDDGRLERVEETNGTFPNRVTTSYYSKVGDIASVTDFRNLTTYFKYIRDGEGRKVALLETNDEDSGRIWRLFNQAGEVVTEIGANGRVTLFNRKPHPSGLGRMETTTEFLIEDATGWLTSWEHDLPDDFASLMVKLDQDQDGIIEASDLATLFNESTGSKGTVLYLAKTHKLFNTKGDVIASVSPEGEFNIYDYELDLVQAKTQTQWSFYTPNPETGFSRINFRSFDIDGTKDWETLGEKLLKVGARDYEELSIEERAHINLDRESAAKTFLDSLGVSEATSAKTIRQHNSNGELVREIDAIGLQKETTYARDEKGMPKTIFTIDENDGSIVKQELDSLGEVVRQMFSSGLVKELTYEKDAVGNVVRIVEDTIYPDGAHATEIRGLNRDGNVTSVTDRNGVVAKIVTRKSRNGEREIVRETSYTDTFGNEISFSKLERVNRFGQTVYRLDRNGVEVTSKFQYDALGRPTESRDTTRYTINGHSIEYQEFSRFNETGELVFKRDKNGREVEFEYIKDKFGNTVEIHERETLSSGAVAHSVRKLSTTGELLSVTDKNGFTTAYAYEKDERGNMTKTYEVRKLRHDFTGDGAVDDRDLAMPAATLALTASREFGTRETAVVKTRSAFGDLLSVTEKNGRTLFYTYVKDSVGNVTRSVETNSEFLGETTRDLNHRGELVAVRDQNGNSVRFDYEYDAVGNVTQSTESHELAPLEDEASQPTILSENLALGAVVTTSTASSGDASASRLVDGIHNPQAYWASSDEPMGLKDSVLITLDLGEPKVITQLNLDTRSDNTKVFVRSFSVSVSQDGETWVEAGRIQGLAAARNVSVSFLEVQAQFVKLHEFQVFGSSGTPGAVQVNEIELFGTTELPVTNTEEQNVTFQNIALGRAVTVSSGDGGSTGAAKSVDGSTSIEDAWLGGSPGSEGWWEMDLGSGETISKISVHTGYTDAHASQFTLKILSIDGTWKTIASESGLGDPDTFTYEFSEQEVQKVRIEGIQGRQTATGDIYQPVLNEVEIFKLIYQEYQFEPAEKNAHELLTALPIKVATNASLEGAEHATDGNFDKEARPKIGDPLTLELSKPMAIGRVDTYLNRDEGVKYKVEVSLDGVSWYTVIDKTQFSRGLQKDSVPPVKAKYVKLTGVERQDGATDFGVSEVRLFPPAGLPVTSTVTRTYNIDGDVTNEIHHGGKAQKFEYVKNELDNVTEIFTHHYRDSEIDEVEYTTSSRLNQEGEVTETVDRQGRVTRYVYDYDEIGNHVGTYRLAAHETETGEIHSTFSGEVRDSDGRVVQEILDSGAVTYIDYELDRFGNITRAYLRDTPGETIQVRPALLHLGGSFTISGEGWNKINFQETEKTNTLFDGLDSQATVDIAAGEEKPLLFEFDEPTDLSGLRLLTHDGTTLGYRIEVTQDGENWTQVAEHPIGNLDHSFKDHAFDETGVTKLRIVPTGDDRFYIYEMQIYGAPREARNFQLVRDYDVRGNLIRERNVLYEIWQSSPKLQMFFPDPTKKGVLGRWKEKTIADWASSEGYLEDSRLHAYTPQLDKVTEDLKVAFDSNRTLQYRYTDQAGLIDWARTEGDLSDPRLSVYSPDHIQSNEAAARTNTSPDAGAAPRFGPDVKEWRPVAFDLDLDPNLGVTLDWSEEETPKSFVVKLDRLQSIDTVRLSLGGWGSSGFGYSVEVSRDGVTWHTAVDKTSGAYEGLQIDQFPQVKALYLRVTGHQDQDKNKRLTLNEIEVFSSLEEPMSFIGTENALHAAWRLNPSLQFLFPDPQKASEVPGRWQAKTLLDWAREEGYKHHASLAAYAPTGVDEVLPGLWQVFDDSRKLQDQFRIDGSVNNGLIKYVRLKGYREDSRLYYYGGFARPRELPYEHTFSYAFDAYGNQTAMLVKDHNGTRTLRRFDEKGRVVEEKPELVLLWEEMPSLFQSHVVSDSLRVWAQNYGSSVPRYAEALSQYAPRSLFGPDKEDPRTTRHQYEYDPEGYLKSVHHTLWTLQGTKGKTEQVWFDSEGQETKVQLDGDSFKYDRTFDRAGRLIRKVGSGKYFQPHDQLRATDIRSSGVLRDGDVYANSIDVSVLQTTLVHAFLLIHGRLPSPAELSSEKKMVLEDGYYLSRCRLFTSPAAEDWDWSTVIGTITSESRGLSSTFPETVLASALAEELLEEVSLARTQEEKLEDDYLAILVQKTVRLLLGRDPNSDNESDFFVAKLRELDSNAAFEEFLKTEYNIDESGISEHERRTNDIHAIIDNAIALLSSLRGATDALPAGRQEAIPEPYKSILRTLQSDPAFEIVDLIESDLEKIKSRLLELTSTNIHFGQSAISSLAYVVGRQRPSDAEAISHRTLTIAALFADTLTGVLSPEFTGDLQFSAYTLKIIAQAYGVHLEGYRLSWDELVKAVEDTPVLANIENRHYVVVTDITCEEACTVTIVENGYTRIKSEADFKSRWFGAALTQANAFDNLLSTQDLLKIKGAGWFSDLFKKIWKLLKKAYKFVARVLKRIVRVVTRALQTVFGKTIGGFLASALLAPVIFFANTYHYLSQGDIKGLMKYWAMTALQIAIAVAVAVLVPQLLGLAFQFLGVLFQGIGAVVGAAGNFLGALVGNLAPGLGAALQGGLNAVATGFTQIGKAFSRFGNKLLNVEKFKDIFQNTFDGFIENFNPIGYYKDAFDLLRNNLFSPDGLTYLTTRTLKKLSIHIAGQEIDEALSKTELSYFTQSILLTTATASLEGIGSVLAGNILGVKPVEVDAASERGPPTNRPGFLQRIGTGISGAAGFVTTALKDAAGKIKSLFIKPASPRGSPLDSSELPFGAGVVASGDLRFPNGVTRQIILDNDGKPLAIKYITPEGESEYGLLDLDNGMYRVSLDGATFEYLEIDPETLGVTYLDQIGGGINSQNAGLGNLDSYLSLELSPFSPFPGTTNSSSVLFNQSSLLRAYGYGSGTSQHTSYPVHLTIPDPRFVFPSTPGQGGLSGFSLGGYVASRYGVNVDGIPKVGRIFRDLRHADKLYRASVAASGGVKLERYLEKGVQYVKVVGKNTARAAVGVPGTRYLPTTDKVVPFANARQLANNIRHLKYLGPVVSGSLAALDAITTGIHQRLRPGEIAINATVDAGIVFSASAAGALLGAGILFSSAWIPLVTAVGVSIGLSELGARFASQPLKNVLKRTFLRDTKEDEFVINAGRQLYDEFLRRIGLRI